MCKPYSPIFTRCGNHIPAHLQHAETLFPTFTEGGNIIPQIVQGVETLFPHMYKVWKPYSTTFTKCGNPILSNLQGVETLPPPPYLLIVEEEKNITYQYFPYNKYKVYFVLSARL